MYTDYLKKRLAEVAATTQRVVELEAEYASHKYRDSCIAGALQSIVEQSARTAKSMIDWTTEHIEPAEREAERRSEKRCGAWGRQQGGEEALGK